MNVCARGSFNANGLVWRLPRWLAVVCGFALLSHSSAAVAASQSAAKSDARPNIIVILSDDMGYSDLGCYGGEIRTPHLDKLAAGGLRFSAFYNTGRCCPTRASLLTGLYPHQAGVGHMTTDQNHPGYSGQLNTRCATFGQVLKPAGYGTYAVGKWHVVKNVDVKPDGSKHNWPLQRGFDRFYGTITGAGSFYDPGTLTRDNTMISPFADAEYKPDRYYYTDAITDHAVRFVTEHKTKRPDSPFFLYVAYTAAHWPMHALEEDVAKYKGKYDAGYDAIRQARYGRLKELGLFREGWGLNATVGKWEQQEHKAWEARCMEVFAAMIDRMDAGIGRLVATLEQQQQLDNTLILFMQDNGGCQEMNGRADGPARPTAPTLPPIAADVVRLDVTPKQDRAGIPTLTGPKNMPGGPETYIAYGLNWANVSNTPFREYKHFVHEGGISTPLIAHWPKGIARKNEWEHQPGHLVDIMATCVDVSKATYPPRVEGFEPQPLEGVSLRPAFEKKSLARTQPLFWEHEGNRAIRDGKWKLVAKENGPWELYDIDADRTETKDLAQVKPDLVTALDAKWTAWATRANVLPLGKWRGNNPATSTPKKAASKKKQAK